MKKIVLIFFISLMICFFLFCDLLKNKNAQNPSIPKIVCVLFDLSLSTQTPDIREAYSENMRIILKSLNPGDAVIGVLITEKSISEIKLGINYELPVFNPSTDNLLFKMGEEREFKKKFKILKDSLCCVADSILKQFNQRILKTEIMSALGIAERVFKSYSQNKKILVIMSDMKEDSDKYNFERENLTERRIKQIISYEKQNHLLPDLEDVKIYVAGAMSEQTRKFIQIQDFWLKYFTVCGASLSKKNYGSMLIRFNE